MLPVRQGGRRQVLDGNGAELGNHPEGPSLSSGLMEAGTKEEQKDPNKRNCPKLSDPTSHQRGARDPDPSRAGMRHTQRAELQAKGLLLTFQSPVITTPATTATLPST